MSNRRRYTVDDIQRDAFYEIPKFLFEDEFKALDSDAKVLYSFLCNHHELSIVNEWVNENGEVYLIFSRKSMCNIIKLSEKTVTKVMNNLQKHKLIEVSWRGDTATVRLI